MALLGVFTRPPVGAPLTSLLEPDPQRLGELLCPYRGQLQRLELSSGILWLSPLADVRGPTGAGAPICTLPRGSRCGPQSAWLRIHRDDQGGVEFETDPLGTFPLWILEQPDCLIVTGEVKSLLALDGVRVELAPDAHRTDQPRPADYSPYRNVRRLPPGASLVITPDARCLVQAGWPLDFAPSPIEDRALAAEQLHAALRGSANSIGADAGRRGTFLSGGIDSSIATALMRASDPALRTYTLGTALGDEYAQAGELAEHLEVHHQRVRADEGSALQHFERAVFCNETVDGLSAETLAQLAVLGEAAAGDVQHVITGYGADLLFGSMLRHEAYMQATGARDLQSLIERTCWTGEFSPFFAWSMGLQLHHLFWDPALMQCAFAIADEHNFEGEHDKVVLRSLAVEAGYMRHEHAFRKKRALTDGTQFNRLLSSALNLDSKHAYAEKSTRCTELMTELLQR